MQHYYKLDFGNRFGYGFKLNEKWSWNTMHKVVATVNKNEYIRVFAGAGDWYVVQIEGDYVGAVSKKYVKPLTLKASNTQNNSNNQTTTNMNADEKEVFNLINQQKNQ